jgi:hypothetical protein
MPLTVFLSSTSAMGQGRAPSAANACALLTPDDIAKAANVKVGTGEAGQPIPGVIGRCTWSGTGGTKVIVTLTATSHMETTIAAEMASGGKAVSGIGSKAVASRAAAMAGGYVLSAIDAKGGFGVSLLGREGTQELVVSLAKVVAGKR